MGDGKGSFWTSVPGLLSAVAALLTAVVGGVTALSSRGGGQSATNVSASGPTSTSAPEPPAAPAPTTVAVAAPASTTVAVAVPAPATTRAAGPRVTALTLSATPSGGTVACPVTITFTGRITVDGPMAVAYDFERSDGPLPGGSVTFTAAGTKEVKATRTFTGASGQQRAGSWALRTTSPVAMTSAKAPFKVTCS